jgi:toxin secretion/phage lysis holin
MEQVYPVIVALIFNALDLVTGLVSAVKNKDIQSSKLRDGLFKKVGFIFCYFVAWLVDTQGHVIGFRLGVTILPIIILYVCTTELVSILENISKINSDILPEKLMELFHITDITKR